MRSTDERMNEVLGRARAREAAARRKRQRAVAAVGGALSVVAVIAVGFGVAFANLSATPSLNSPFGLMGSVFSGGSALGYIVVGLLGLALGVAVTVLAFRLGDRGRGLLDSAKGDSNVRISAESASEAIKAQFKNTPSQGSDVNSPELRNSGSSPEGDAGTDGEGCES